AKDIVVEGERVAGTDFEAGEELLIEPLYARLKKEAEKTLFIAGVNPSLELSREVVILGDRRIPFNLLQKVMYTCGQVGYNNISLAVMSLE
ncbi:MAG: biopolymer transporter ExbD, partial [Thermodesulfobacteriota bacterium]